jgi:alpha-L-arabinofuranosidase
VDSPAYGANYYDPRGSQDFWFPVTSPFLKIAAVLREDGKALTLFALNRSLDEAMPLEVVASGFGTLRLRAARQLHHADLKAVNTREDPMQVSPASLDDVRIEGKRVYAMLAPASWTMIRLDITR